MNILGSFFFELCHGQTNRQTDGLEHSTHPIPTHARRRATTLILHTHAITSHPTHSNILLAKYIYTTDIWGLLSVLYVSVNIPSQPFHTVSWRIVVPSRVMVLSQTLESDEEVILPTHSPPPFSSPLNPRAPRSPSYTLLSIPTF